MNYNHLYYFYVAAKTGGITTAAEQLHISQPSLSSQIKVLEESFGFKLFEKVGRKNRLTSTGEIIFGYCRQMFELAEKMSTVMKKTTPSARGKIQIGATPEVEKEFITEVVSRFIGSFQGMERPQVNLSTAPLNQLTAQLQFKGIDTFITSQTVGSSGFMRIEQVDVSVVLCCSSKWNDPKLINAEDNQSAIEALKSSSGVQWVLPSANFQLRSQIDKFLDDHLIDKKVVFESDSFSALARSVHNELGFSFLPFLHIANEIKGKNLNQLGSHSGFWKYQMTLACNNQNKNDRLIEGFIRSFKETSKEVSPSCEQMKMPAQTLQVYT